LRAARALFAAMQAHDSRLKLSTNQTGLSRCFSFSRLSLPHAMRGNRGAIAAEGYAAPAAGIRLRSTQKHERTILALAAADAPQVRVADQVSNGLGDRHQETLRRDPPGA
jgi:hypothetical protein